MGDMDYLREREKKREVREVVLSAMPECDQELIRRQPLNPFVPLAVYIQTRDYGQRIRVC
jgi:hypothetical protein